MIEHEQIERLLEVNRLNEASALIRSAFTHAPSDPQLHCYAARVALKRDDSSQADEHLRLALAADPSHDEARILRFLVLLDSRQYADAEIAITELIREDPDNAELLALYARLMLYTLHIDKASALVGEALRRDPNSLQARICLVLLATVRGETSVADHTLAELVTEDPEASGVAFTLLQVLIGQKRFREALSLGRELLRADPSNEHLVETLVELRATTHWLSLPAYPIARWGGLFSGGMWFTALVGLTLLRRVNLHWAVYGAGLYVGYVLYSWVHGPLLKRWLRTRGI